jgi:hypothetical protein
MRISDVISAAPTLITPTDLKFYALRVGAGSEKLVPAGTKVKYTIERTGDYGDDLTLRLFLLKQVMGYKTYTWSATFESRDEMIQAGFEVK